MGCHRSIWYADVSLGSATLLICTCIWLHSGRCCYIKKNTQHDKGPILGGAFGYFCPTAIAYLITWRENCCCPWEFYIFISTLARYDVLWHITGCDRLPMIYTKCSICKFFFFDWMSSTTLKWENILSNHGSRVTDPRQDICFFPSLDISMWQWTELRETRNMDTNAESYNTNKWSLIHGLCEMSFMMN